MNNIAKFTCAALIVILCASSAHGQGSTQLLGLDSLQKVAIQKEIHRQDSILRVMMRDSLNLSTGVIDQVFSLKGNFSSHSEEIRYNSSLSLTQKADALRDLVFETDAAIKELLGDTAFKKYSQLITSRKENF